MIVVETGSSGEFVVKKDDIVLINKYAGSEFTINNETYILIKQCDILGIIKEDTI